MPSSPNRLQSNLLQLSPVASSPIVAGRWSPERANEWYKAQSWLVGCNFYPSTAINQLEMWQEDTFDPETINRELGWAASIGMNSVRVYLHDLAWKQDPAGFMSRVEQFLKIADSHGISVMFVIFDAVWGADPKPGKQPDPVPGVHNSGWMQSPSAAVLADPAQWDYLETYVKELISTYAHDDRVVVWDLYNEPGNSDHGVASLPLLKKVFEWAREINPSQPLTAGVWNYSLKENIAFQLENSDIITFHNYRPADALEKEIQDLKAYARPVICTEYLARSRGNWLQTSLLLFREHNVGAYNWGLVSGKSQTIFPWKSPENAPEPDQWFHDIFRADGSPYDAAEMEFFRLITRLGRSAAGSVEKTLDSTLN